MDRNSFCRYPARCVVLVALRKESVDRNRTMQIVIIIVRTSLSARRAWIEISRAASCQQRSHQSLSARRAWIEMPAKFGALLPMYVALRKESVDRNIFPPVDTSSVNVSLSARRAWIEISTRSQPSRPKACRSPQGERG